MSGAFKTKVECRCEVCKSMKTFDSETSFSLEGGVVINKYGEIGVAVCPSCAAFIVEQHLRKKRK